MKLKHTRILILLIALTVLLSACGPSSEETSPSEPQAAPSVPALEQAPGSLATPLPKDYPAPEAVLQPTRAVNDADYPAPPTWVPTVDPYPGGLVWVIKPVGIQCEDGTEPGYGDLREAQSTLTAAGVAVADAEMTEMMVATSCGSPTSAHYRLQIASEDAQTAISLGWTLE